MQGIPYMNAGTKRFFSGIGIIFIMLEAEMGFNMGMQNYAQRRFRRKKEYGAPKKALTAFLFYLLDKRVHYRRLYPGLHHREIVSEIGQSWNRLSPEQREPYEAMAQKDRDRYDREKEEYMRTRQPVNNAFKVLI